MPYKIVLGLALVGAVAGASPTLPFHGTPRATTWGKNPKVALYVGKGSWDAGKEHLKWFFQENGFSYTSVEAKDVLGGALEALGVRLLVMPGGESWEYLKELGDTGARKIREFVNGGGGYLGICAGAFYATSLRQGGQATGPYGIGLLEGTAYDGTALHTAPFVDGMMDIDTSDDEFMTDFQETYRMSLFGGPSFHYTAEEAEKKNLHVLMEFQLIREPAMILFEYGEGRVYLSGPHLEIEENRTDWGAAYYDPESDWPILERVTHHLLRDETGPQ